MKFFVTAKQAGKKKDVIARTEYFLEEDPKTLREFISAIVSKNVKEFNEKTGKENILGFLTQEDIDNHATQTGKVGFGQLYSDQKADVNKSVENAIICFTDGIYKVFIDEQEIEDLDATINISPESSVIFIKLTMLAGRMW
jgi:hypothetical protein